MFKLPLVLLYGQGYICLEGSITQHFRPHAWFSDQWHPWCQGVGGYKRQRIHTPKFQDCDDTIYRSSTWDHPSTWKNRTVRFPWNEKQDPPLLFFILKKCLANTRHPPNPWGMCFAAPWEADPPMYFCKTKDVGAITGPWHIKHLSMRPSLNLKKQNCVFSMEWKIGPPLTAGNP